MDLFAWTFPLSRLGVREWFAGWLLYALCVALVFGLGLPMVRRGFGWARVLWC